MRLAMFIGSSSIGGLIFLPPFAAPRLLKLCRQNYIIRKRRRNELAANQPR